MNAKAVSRKVIYALAAIAVAFAASMLWGNPQAHAASSTVARIVDNRGFQKASYNDLQAAFNAVEDNQRIQLTKDIDARKTFRIDRGKTFNLDLHGHTITSELMSIDYILRIENGCVNISNSGFGTNRQTGIIGKYTARCIRLDP